MNSVKIIYLICAGFTELMFFAGAILIPIYLTPGFYYWTAFCTAMLFVNSAGYSNRLDTWNWKK